MVGWHSGVANTIRSSAVARVDVRGLLSTGAHSVALDGNALRELGRVDGRSRTIAFGLIGALSASEADTEARTRAQAVAWDRVSLTEHAPEAKVIVFLDRGQDEQAVFERIELQAEQLPLGGRSQVRVTLHVVSWIAAPRRDAKVGSSALRVQMGLSTTGLSATGSF